MTGKATIILSDAVTGAEIKRVEEHNLVTNALRNIFNPPHFALVNGFDYSRLFYYGLPMWKYLLGGVMLLGNREEEDADNILLSANSVPIATAGTEYAGTCTTRGTLNLNETYQTDNGYHFTWDFATDKANGTISCICLTNRLFGNNGFGTENYGYGSMLMAPNRMDITSGTSSMNFVRGLGQYVGTYEDGLHVFMYLTKENTLEFRRYTGVQPSALLINDVYGLPSVPEPVSLTTLPLDVDVNYENTFFLNSLEKTVYFFETSYAEKDDTSLTVRYSAVNFEKNTSTVHTVRFETAPTHYYNQGAVFNGKIYLSTSNGVQEFSKNGSLIRTVDASASSYNRYFVMNGQLMMSYNSGGNILVFDWDKIITAGHPHFILGSVSTIPAPYIATCARTCNGKNSGYTNGNKPVLAINTSYKATINNLATPIVKTSDNTLKIVYDITN